MEWGRSILVLLKESEEMMVVMKIKMLKNLTYVSQPDLILVYHFCIWLCSTDLFPGFYFLFKVCFGVGGKDEYDFLLRVPIILVLLWISAHPSLPLPTRKIAVCKHWYVRKWSVSFRRGKYTLGFLFSFFFFFLLCFGGKWGEIRTESSQVPGNPCYIAVWKVSLYRAFAA